MSDITVEVHGEHAVLKQGDEIIRRCGCCGKLFDPKAALIIATKIRDGELGWRLMYTMGRHWEVYDEARHDDQ